MLDQRGDFVQQRGDFRIVAQRGGQAAGVVQQLALDVGAAALERGHDAALVGQRGGIGVGVGYRHRAIAHEAVAQRFAAGGQAQRGHGHHVGAVQRDQAVGRTHELDGGHAVGQLVAHYLGNGQAVDGGGDAFLQARGQRGGGGAAGDQVVLLAVGFAFQRGQVDVFQALGGQLLCSAGVAWPSSVRPIFTGISFSA